MRFLLQILVLISVPITPSHSSEEDCAKAFLQYVNAKLSTLHDQKELTSFNLNIDLTEENRNNCIKADMKLHKAMKETKLSLQKFNWDNFKDVKLRKQAKLLQPLDDNILPTEKYQELESLIHKMYTTYSSVKVPDFHLDTEKNLSKVELDEKFKEIQNPAELKHLWCKFSDEIGPKILPLFHRYVQLKQEAHRLANLPQNMLFWETKYEDPNFASKMDSLIDQMKPFYKEIHAFVRHRLNLIYGNYIPRNGPIPTHLIGDIHTEDFEWMVKMARPYEEIAPIFPDLLQQQKFTRRELYEIVEKFFDSIGLPPLPESFWKESVFEELPGRKMNCHLYVYFIHNNYVLSDCEGSEDLSSLNIRLWGVACLELNLLAVNQPYAYRRNLLIALGYGLWSLAKLSTGTLKYLSTFQGLNYSFTDKDFFNQLFSTSLSDVPYIFNSYLTQKWRRNVLLGQVNENHYNCEFWKLFHEYMGVEPPVNRTNKDFDAGFSLHVSYDRNILDKTVGMILGYQLHKELCLKIGEYDPLDSRKPLHACSLYGQKSIGKLLVAGLEVGWSERWNYILEVVSGKGDLEVGALLEYYRPLMDWLTEDNKKNGATIGWGSPRSTCNDVE